MSGSTRWSLSVSKDTDVAVRTLLAQRGMKKGDLSKFIENSVRWRVFEENLADARSGFSDMTPEAIETLISEAVLETRNVHR